MKIPKGKVVVIGNHTFVNEVPEKFVTPELEKALEEKTETSKPKAKKKKVDDKS